MENSFSATYAIVNVLLLVYCTFNGPIYCTFNHRDKFLSYSRIMYIKRNFLRPYIKRTLLKFFTYIKTPSKFTAYACPFSNVTSLL